MQCAKCPGSLEPLRRDGLALDRCPACLGLFFDPGELTRVFEDRNPETLREELCALPVVADARPAARPRCLETMNRVASTQVPHVSHDVCLACNGVRLDAGELAALDLEHSGRRSPAETVRNLAPSVQACFGEDLALIGRARDERLGRLRRRGLLNARAFKALQARVERAAGKARDAALRSGVLQDLDRLRDDGILTKAEHARMSRPALRSGR
jgi:Zn-finger nucleic acid-binding protein